MLAAATVTCLQFQNATQEPRRRVVTMSCLVVCCNSCVTTTHKLSAHVRTHTRTVGGQYVKRNKAKDEDWFKLESNAEGTR
jgi:hypothetical protein